MIINSNLYSKKWEKGKVKSIINKENAHNIGGNDSKNVREKRKEDKKKRLYGVEPSKRLELPNLNIHKQNMLNDIIKRKKTNTRDEIITNLQHKMTLENNNTEPNILMFKNDIDVKCNNLKIDTFFTDPNIDDLKSNVTNRDFSRKHITRI